MQNNRNELLDEVANYYSNKLSRHGQTPAGVDWNGEASQLLRFQQLCKLITVENPFTLIDLGCGYGALYGFLAKTYDKYSYIGVDVSEDMIDAALSSHQDIENARFMVGHQPDAIADYCIASGIFNVRLKNSDEEWKKYILRTLDMLNEASQIGFAFNCLTSYSDHDKMKDYLFYADPCWLFDLCKKRYSRNVALLHDYGLYEFTILARKMQ